MTHVELLCCIVRGAIVSYMLSSKSITRLLHKLKGKQVRKKLRKKNYPLECLLVHLVVGSLFARCVVNGAVDELCVVVDANAGECRKLLITVQLVI